MSGVNVTGKTISKHKRGLSVVLHFYTSFIDLRVKLVGRKIGTPSVADTHKHTFNFLSTELLGFLPHHLRD